MPWRETHPMDQRTQFVREARRQQEDMTVLCARYGISRKTGYKWLERYELGGAGGTRGAVATPAFLAARDGSRRPRCDRPGAQPTSDLGW